MIFIGETKQQTNHKSKIHSDLYLAQAQVRNKAYCLILSSFQFDVHEDLLPEMLATVLYASSILKPQ